uniref:PHP domain-containing protein n=1 Tax=Nocardia wallacei TaxID=480035 RepID=UPI002455D760
MGWGNGPPTWAEMERVLSGRPGRTDDPPGDGGDSPAWSRKRGEYQAGPRPEPGEPVVPYAELHAHSAYSFLDGASQPEELVEEAVRLGLEALALTDHDGLYGVVRFAEAAAEWGLPTIFGAELSLSDPVVADSEPRAGAPDPGGAPQGGGGPGGGGGGPRGGGGGGPAAGGGGVGVGGGGGVPVWGGFGPRRGPRVVVRPPDRRRDRRLRLVAGRLVPR